MKVYVRWSYSKCARYYLVTLGGGIVHVPGANTGALSVSWGVVSASYSTSD